MACVWTKFVFEGESHATRMEFSRVPAIGEVVGFVDRLWTVDRLVHFPIRRDAKGEIQRDDEAKTLDQFGGKMTDAVIWLSEPADE